MIRRQRFGKPLELCINLLSVVLISYILVVIGRDHLWVQGNHNKANGLSVGDSVRISDVNWKASGRTLVFALSTACHYCSASAPFYRELLKKRSGQDWQAVAVLPQSPDLARGYFESKGFEIPVIKQMDLGVLGVTGTPTLLLIDQTGKLQQQWIGKLPRSQEKDVAEHLGIRDLPEYKENEEEASVGDGNGYSPLITTSELLALFSATAKLNVVDTRQEYQYAHGHIKSAVNIPVTELGVRAAREIDTRVPTVIYCEFSAACQASGVFSRCAFAAYTLKKFGVTNFRIIRDSLPLLGEAGIPIIGKPDISPQEQATSERLEVSQ